MGVRLSIPNIYYYTDDVYDYKSIDFGDFYRCIESCDKYVVSDQLYSCVTYANEGEKIEYVFPPNYRDNEQGSRKII
jgi:hypothetical protein